MAHVCIVERKVIIDYFYNPPCTLDDLKNLPFLRFLEEILKSSSGIEKALASVYNSRANLCPGNLVFISMNKGQLKKMKVERGDATFFNKMMDERNKKK